MSGVDVTQIDAIGVEAVEVVLSEYGPDLSRFPSEKEFVSHATLAPHVAKSGGKPVKKKKHSSASTRVANVLRMAALSLRHSNTALGSYYRHLSQRLGADGELPVAVRSSEIVTQRHLMVPVGDGFGGRFIGSTAAIGEKGGPPWCGPARGSTGGCRRAGIPFVARLFLLRL